MSRKNAKFRLAMWSIITVMLISLFVEGLYSRHRFYNMSNFIQIGDFHQGLNKINEWTVKSDGLKNIILDLKVDDITIRTTKDKNIKIVESSNYELSKKEELKIVEEGRNVKIYRDHKLLNKVSLGENKLKRIDIYIPESYKENLSVNNNVGDIDVLSNLNLDKFDISQNVGDLSIEGNIICNKFSAKSNTGKIESAIINTKEYDIMVSVGDIELDGLTGKGTIKAATGDIECKIDKIDGDINIDSKVGDIEVSIADSLSFELDAKCRVGDIDSDFPGSTSSKDEKEVRSSIGENASSTINIRSDVGDINIYKK